MTLTHAPGDTRTDTRTDTSELPALDPATDAGTRPVDDLHEAPAAPGPLGGVPGLVGLPVVVTGGTGLVLANLGLFPEGAVTATLTILLGCTVVGLTIATVWAAALGDSISASLYAVFGGFYASYVALAAATAHGWFGTTEDAAVASTAWLVCWLVTIGLLLPITLRLAGITTLMLLLVEVALVLLTVAGVTESTLVARAAAVAVAGFVATVAWQYADLMLRATGGRGLPLGRPVLRG